MAHFGVLIASVPEPQSRFLAALVAEAVFYQYWPCKGLCWLAPSGTCPKNDVTAIGREFRRWEPDIEAIIWMKRQVLRGWDLQDLHLSMRSANGVEFEYFQLEAFLPHPGFSEGNEREHLRLHLLYPNNNRFENGNESALGPSGPDESSNSLYP